jgi:hypothetical protein
MTVHHIESGERRPDMNMTALVVTGSPGGSDRSDRPCRNGFRRNPRGASVSVGFWSMRLAPRFDSLPDSPLIFPA